MAYIYKITNDINGKIYIGKTYGTIEKRFKQHCKDSQKEKCENRPLYRAMNKYGIEHFSVEQVEETDNLEERETYWIEYYGSFKNGYNATLGGDGKPYLDYELILETYKQTKNQAQTAILCNCSTDSVSKILKLYNQETLNGYEVTKLKTSKIVNQYTKDGIYIRSFPSCIEAARSLQTITNTSNGASSHISDVCRGKRKSAYGYKWKFKED